MANKSEDVSTIIKGRVYSVSTYAPFYGKDTVVSSTSIKVFGPTTSLDNPGIKAESLLEVVFRHYEEKETLSGKEKATKEILQSLINHLKE